MTGVIAIVSSKPPTNDLAKQPVDWRLEQLIDRLPVSLRSRVRWLRRDLHQSIRRALSEMKAAR